MLKQKASWYKPALLPGLIGRKKVDWSIFEDGTPIPVEFHEDFEKANHYESIPRGDKRNITLIIEGKPYSATLRNLNRKGVATDTLHIRYDQNDELKELLLKHFQTSYQYILKERDVQFAAGKERPNVKVPDDLAEYLDFFETDSPYQYRVEFVTSK